MHTQAAVTDPRETKQVCAFVDQTTKRKLEAVASRNQRSVAGELRVALSKHLDAEGELVSASQMTAR